MILTRPRLLLPSFDVMIKSLINQLSCFNAPKLQLGGSYLHVAEILKSPPDWLPSVKNMEIVVFEASDPAQILYRFAVGSGREDLNALFNYPLNLVIWVNTWSDICQTVYVTVSSLSSANECSRSDLRFGLRTAITD